MKSMYSPSDAWDAFESKNYQLAEQIWLKLMASVADPDTQCSYQLAYASVLIAQKRFHEAGDLLAELFEITGNSLCLHQLGYIAREEGKLDVAKGHFLAEQACLCEEELEAHAANACELGLISLRQNRARMAVSYTELSLEYARQTDAPMLECCALRLLGDIRRELGEDEAAQDCYLAFAEIAPGLELDKRPQQLGHRLFQLLPLLERSD
ncbi:MAG: tetratricopeptide repeat protein [Candidatus Sericytochromatia bacterium]